MSAETIWKFPLAVIDEQTVKVPARVHRVLTVGLDPAGQLCMWAVVDTSDHYPYSEDHPDLVRVWVVGTGNPMPNVAASWHIGSVVQGPFVWHVFTDALS